MRIRRCALRALLDGHQPVAAQRRLQLVARLHQQLLAVRQHQHLTARQASELSKNHGFAGTGRQAHDHALATGAARLQHGVDGFLLVRAQGGRRHGTPGKMLSQVIARTREK